MGVPLLMVRMKDKENGGEQVSGELTGQKIVGGTCHLDSLGLQRSCAGSLISSVQIFRGNGSLTRRPSER